MIMPSPSLAGFRYVPKLLVGVQFDFRDISFTSTSLQKGDAGEAHAAQCCTDMPCLAVADTLIDNLTISEMLQVLTVDDNTPGNPVFFVWDGTDALAYPYS